MPTHKRLINGTLEAHSDPLLLDAPLDDLTYLTEAATDPQDVLTDPIYNGLTDTLEAPAESLVALTDPLEALINLIEAPTDLIEA